MIVGGTVKAVHRSSAHEFSKKCVPAIHIIAGLGVVGDAHAGDRVQHLSRVRADPTQPNLRQVHLMHAELFDELEREGFAIKPGDLGENITTRSLDLLTLGRDTMLYIGDETILRVTGLRNPCAQIEAFAHGLLKEVALKTPQGIIRKAGIMCVAIKSGEVRIGDTIRVERPNGLHIRLERV